MAAAIGVLLPHLAARDGAARRRVLHLAEDVGLDHVGVGDHVSFRNGAGSDGLLAAAGVLAASERLATNTGVYLLPLRHPVTVARQVADLAVLGPGRFVLGVGVGGEDRHEVEVCGVDPATRGRRTDEALAVVRALLAGEEVDADGEHFSLRAAQVVPAPTVPVPILVGGRSEAAVRRAGRYGDGWFGIWVSPARYRQALDTVAEAAADAGRPPPQLHALNVWCGVDDDGAEAAQVHVRAAMHTFYGIPYERFARWSPAGTPAEVAAFLAPYLDAGCGLVNLIVNGRSVEHEVDAAGEVRRLLLETAA